MLHSESFAQLAAALAVAQGKFPVIPKDRKVKVRTKKTYANGDPIEYEFWYAPLDTILGAVRGPLSENGLALIQSVVVNTDKSESIRTMLAHSTGEWISNDTPLFTGGGDNASQAYASGMTYARRYGVTALLCVAADDDDDGNGNDDGKRPQSSGSKPQGNAPKSAPAKPAYTPPADDSRVGIHDLSDSQKRLLLAKAKSVGLDEESLIQKFELITPANINDVLNKLKPAE